MASTESDAEENRRLRRTMRDLVSLSTLPALWVGLGVEGIAGSLADVLISTLGLDVAYLRLPDLAGDVVEVVRSPHVLGIPAWTSLLAPVLELGRTEPLITIPDPIHGGSLHVAVTRFGIGSDAGQLITASRHPEFPTERDRLLLGVGANQTAIVVQRQRAEIALRKSEEKLRWLADSIPQMAWMAQPDGHVFWFNRRWYDYTGTTPEQMENSGWKKLHDPQFLPLALERWNASLRTGDPFDMVFPLRGADGAFRPFLTRVNPLRGPDGKILLWFGTNTDISEIKRMEESLRDADRRKDEFVATLAHELRNPLAPISNSLQILKMPRVDAATIEQTREMMERQVHHLVRLVEDLMDVSRVMRDKIDLRREPIELASIVARAAETVQPLVAVKHHKLDIAVSSEPQLLDADPVRLIQVVGNLLTNAAKYTNEGGHIWLTAGVEKGQAVLRVRDNGIGIAPDLLRHIFELFVQVDHSETRSQGGLGIGLTLVKNLVEVHGGSVEAHSGGLGKGCEFVCRLPLLHQPRSRPESPEPFVEPIRADAGHRLMVVDDNKDAAISLAALFRLKGYDVRIAHSGSAALEMAAAYCPKVLFLDIGMPGMDGYEVARRIRQISCLERVILIALTGWGQLEDRRRTAEAGFDHHLVKPIDPAQLDGLLADLLANGTATR